VSTLARGCGVGAWLSVPEGYRDIHANLPEPELAYFLTVH
jgi:hypothetical protein